MERKLPFGLKNGSLVDVTQVNSGLECGCICPACGSALVARKGSKTIHHFAHHNTAECKGAYQTALHLAAKEIFGKHKKIRIPAVSPTLGNSSAGIVLHSDQLLTFESVILEKKLDKFIPDIILELKGYKLLIEIAVTHFVDDAKKEAIKNIGISALEIDLSGLNREITLKELEDILIEDTKLKKWIYNRKKALFEERIYALAREFSVTRRGMAAHVDNCPLRMRIFKGLPYANLIDDCFGCKYFLDSEGNSMDSHTSILCLGHAQKEIDELVSVHKKS